MAQNTLFDLKSEVLALCQDVALFIKKEIHSVSSGDIEFKELNSLVSYVDKEAEKTIVAKLQTLLPEAGFITEENTVAQEDKDLIWIIDPLDGTTNFLYKIPHFSISIALMKNKELVFGMVYEVMHDTAYTAIKGFGAWENNEPISIKSTSELKEAMVVTGFPYKRDSDIDKNMAVLKYCILNCRGIRRLGSAALDLAYVASGKVDIYYEKTLNIWDIAAGVLIVNEAGGRVSDFDNSNNYLAKGSIIAANSKLHPQIASVIQSCHA